MMLTPLLANCAICAVAVIATYLIYRLHKSMQPHFHPGPPADPLIGHLRRMTGEYQEKTFAEWGKKYGDVIYIHFLGQKLVILNSLEAARDLLEKRSAIYSDRPPFVLFTDLMGWDSVLTHMPYGERFRRHRRFIHDSFNRRAIQAFRPVQERETYVLLEGLLQDPESFKQHIRRYAAAIIMKITYGHDVQSVDDLYVGLAERAATATIECNPASTLVDFFPSLKHVPTWMPGAGFKRSALEVREEVQKLLNMPFEMVKSNMRAGTAYPSFTSTLLEEHIQTGQETAKSQDEDDIKGAAGVLYGAAADTTVAVISNFFLAMLLYPAAYQKAQEEMDRVIGPDRLPTLDDIQSLPYLDCVLKEVYRWNCVVPLGIPHRVMEDDIYRGCYVPKGAMVIANIWAMTQACAEPHIFRPERYLDCELALPDPRDMVFGFGRRICPGKDFGETNVWLAIANIVATLNIAPRLDKAGREMTPEAAFTSGFVSHPKPFSCAVKPRSAKASELISDARHKA